MSKSVSVVVVGIGVVTIVVVSVGNEVVEGDVVLKVDFAEKKST